nr:uncharacterized mitochondrial protein AtMg00810-like [Tanacetum cinerariifolium]
MLAPGNYVQWKSRIKRCIDTKPNHEIILYCHQNPPYKYKWADKDVPVTEGLKQQLKGIDNDIYSTVDACPNACEMGKAIERSQQAATRNRGKAIVNSPPPIYDQEPSMVAEDDEMSKDKEIDKDNSLRINRGTGYDNQRIVNVAGAREAVEQADWRGDTEYEPEDQELEAHYMYMKQIQEELFAHQETISIMSQQKEAHIKFHNTREDKEIDKVIALENKVKVLDNIVYKTGQSVQTMNKLNRCYNDNLALMLAPESDEVIRLEKESRSKLSNLIKPFDYEKLNNLYDLFVPQREKSSAQRYFSERSKMSHTPINNENSKESFNKQTTLLEKRMDESSSWDQNCKSSKELFKIKKSVAMIFDGVERCKQTIAKKTYFGNIDPFIENTIEGNFCPEIQRINADLEKFHLCLKEEMVADLRYFNSLKLEVDSLKSQLENQKTQFLNEIDQISREYYYADHMNAILGVYTELDEVTNLQSKPTEKHLTTVKRIFRYLKDTIHMGLWYSKDTDFELTAFSDSDHVGCLDSRKSTSGSIQFLGVDKLVSWSSKKQDCTSMSSVEVEYVSLSASCAQVLWIRTQLTDYGFHFDKIPMYCDSKAAIAISCNPLADLFTKALPKDRFKYLVRRHVCISGKPHHLCIMYKQIWAPVSIKKMNDIVRLQALIDRKKVIITEASVRQALHLDDDESVDCLSNEEIFAELARMGVGKGFSRVDTPLFEGMLVPQQIQVDIDAAEEDEDAAEPTPHTPATTPLTQQELIPLTSQVAPTPPPSPHQSPIAPPSSPP